MTSDDPRLDALKHDLFLILAADLRFFRRRPDRRHRVRLAGRAEIEEAAIRLGLSPQIPPGFRAFCGLRALASGVVHRVFGYAPEHTETDVPEADAADAYQFLAPHDGATLISLAAQFGAAPSSSDNGMPKA